MGFYMGGKNESAPFVFFTVQNRDNGNGIYFSDCSGYIGI